MNTIKHLLPGLAFFFCLCQGLVADTPLKIAVVDSYHPEYAWSQGTNEGLASGLLDIGLLDDRQQVEDYAGNDRVTSSRAVLQRYWMDSKRKDSQSEINRALLRITQQLEIFQPDIIFLGDDNAANYIGNYFLDSPVPVVFWGVNVSPLKYGLIESVEAPGHNVTGVYQKSYHIENIEHLKQFLPGIRKIAVLSDASPTGRAHTKMFQSFVQNTDISMELVKVVITNSFEQWQQETLVLQEQVDAFLISTFHTFKDRQGNAILPQDAARWYLKNINIPESVTTRSFVDHGFLACIDDSAFKQGYEAAKIARQILLDGRDAGDISPYAPEHGGFFVNRWRAGKLGLLDNIEANRSIITGLVDAFVSLDE